MLLLFMLLVLNGVLCRCATRPALHIQTPGKKGRRGGLCYEEYLHTKSNPTVPSCDAGCSYYCLGVVMAMLFRDASRYITIRDHQDLQQPRICYNLVSEGRLLRESYADVWVQLAERSTQDRTLFFFFLPELHRKFWSVSLSLVILRTSCDLSTMLVHTRTTGWASWAINMQLAEHAVR